MQTRRFPQIPERIERLEELAYNLKWSWDYRARLLFKRLDPDLWKNTQHNPVKLLHDIDPVRLTFAARDPDFLREYEVTMKGLDRATRRTDKWFPREFPDLAKEPIAYFSAEFGLARVRDEASRAPPAEAREGSAHAGIESEQLVLAFLRTHAHAI